MIDMVMVRYWKFNDYKWLPVMRPVLSCTAAIHILTPYFVLQSSFAEDPDNRGGGMRPGGGMHMRHAGQEVSPEEIFNMFFGGGMPGMHAAGGPGFHFYSTGFGPGGVQFRTAQRPRRARGRGAAEADNAQEETSPSLGLLLQLLPVLLIAFLSFMRANDTGEVNLSGIMPGEGKFFSLTVSQ